jgi:hypothetical protein
MTMSIVDGGRWPRRALDRIVWAVSHAPGDLPTMTAATAVHASSAAPALAGKTAASVFVAFSAAVIGIAVAPIAVLGVILFAVVVLGMIEIGRSVDRTFETLTEIVL